MRIPSFAPAFRGQAESALDANRVYETLERLSGVGSTQGLRSHINSAGTLFTGDTGPFSFWAIVTAVTINGASIPVYSWQMLLENPDGTYHLAGAEGVQGQGSDPTNESTYFPAFEANQQKIAVNLTTLPDATIGTIVRMYWSYGPWVYFEAPPGVPVTPLTVTDGTHFVSFATNLDFVGATVSGSSGNATVTITPPAPYIPPAQLASKTTFFVQGPGGAGGIGGPYTTAGSLVLNSVTPGDPLYDPFGFDEGNFNNAGRGSSGWTIPQTGIYHLGGAISISPNVPLSGANGEYNTLLYVYRTPSGGSSVLACSSSCKGATSSSTLVSYADENSFSVSLALQAGDLISFNYTINTSTNNGTVVISGREVWIHLVR